jgi:hypothetical protein
MVVFDNFNFDINYNTTLSDILTILEHRNSPEEIFMLLVVEILFWTLLSIVLIIFLPRKYAQYRKDIFIFFTVINIGLLFIGIVLTILMIIFGLSWATHRVSRPNYETIKFEDEIAKFPVVYSKFQEGVLTMEGSNREDVSSDDKIKSLKILYDSNAQGNIGKIKKFLSDNSDETRLYAFALVSSFEKRLNDRITELHQKIRSANESRVEKYNFELANTYWQFIFHGVADEQLAGFYTKKIEDILKDIKSNPSAFILLGKIHIFNREYIPAQTAFLKAIELGVPKEAMSTFLAEIKFGLKKYNEVADYILPQQFNLDLRLKPLISMWGRK